uniref:Peptidase C1A papain C-terminal domain-containing protein n=1 Tax=Musa acuminata subsp. malaccensis TaxID=214687 RepID=A0A804KJV6_MUSAM
MSANATSLGMDAFGSIKAPPSRKPLSLSWVLRRPMAAARFLLLLVGAFLLLSWARADHNPILLVTDRARSLDSSLFAGVLGRTHDALRFARFARRLPNVIFSLQKDWRDDGIVSPVKNQGHCGSCWTFSTTGALEAAHTQATGKSVSLSEQQLVDCANAFNNFGCNGGLPSQAFEYIKYNGGLDTEESYPYRGVNGVCQYKPEKVGVKVLDSVNITLGAEDELKHAVGVVRPVSVAFEVVNGFRLYKGGVYTSDTCGKTPMDVNHAVLAVGYGVENGVPYWLIKNSWGEDWGVDGYFKMEMGKNMCGVSTCASYPIVAA